MSDIAAPRVLDTTPLDRLVVEAEYPRSGVQPTLDGIDAALLLDLTPETRQQLVDYKKRISTRLDQSADVRRRLLETKASIERLLDAGHPSEPKGIEDELVAQEIDARIAEMRRARARFRAEATP